MLEAQNFSVYANSDTVITIDIDPDDGITLVGAVITWRVYAQAYGLPTPGIDPVISKSSAGDGGTIVVTDPDQQILEIPLLPADTVSLLRNYYHECTVEDPDRGTIIVANGIMTVLGTENRE